jgi:hypothetical protein
MVHIYYLHTAMPAEVMAQRKSILTCMEALERVSEIWLVGKMVHDLFEAVLAFDGVYHRLEKKPAHDKNNNVPSIRSRARELEFNESSSPEPQESGKAIKSLTLTPALIAHMNAALKSAAAPNIQEVPHNSSKATTASENLRPIAPRIPGREDFIPSGIEYILPSTTVASGLNAAEWLVKFTVSYIQIAF